MTDQARKGLFSNGLKVRDPNAPRPRRPATQVVFNVAGLRLYAQKNSMVEVDELTRQFLSFTGVLVEVVMTNVVSIMDVELEWDGAVWDVADTKIPAPTEEDWAIAKHRDGGS